MAKKASPRSLLNVVVTTKTKKPTVKQQLATLKATIREYFDRIRYRQPEYTIKLPAKIAVENNVPKDHAVNVPSLIASVVTAQGLGKEIRVKAVQDPTGGALIIEFYTPVQVESNGPLLLS
jgi:hypothetical protein